MSQEKDRKRQLDEERRRDKNHPDHQNNPSKKDTEKNTPPPSRLKKISKGIAEKISLSSLIETRDMFFVVAIMMAGLKDIFDLGIIGTLATPLALITTFAAMLICGSKHLFGKKKTATLLLGNLIELIPGLNFLPLEITTTLLIYFLILKERREARAEEEAKKTDKKA